MKPYIAFSKAEGPQEGAVLVIANTVREAKKLAWGQCWNVDEWIDLAVRLMRDVGIMKLANQSKLTANEPHVVDSPLGCQSCGLWGAGVKSDGACCYCGEQVGEILARCLAESQ